MTVLFTILITLQFAVVALHDLVTIPGWTHGAQVREAIGRRKLWLATLINSIFPGTAAGFALYYFDRPHPRFVSDYWIIYCAVTLVFAITMWYIPYFFGTNEERKREYLTMYAGTRQVLPARGENPRPNLLHLCFHVLFVLNFVLVVTMRIRGG